MRLVFTQKTRGFLAKDEFPQPLKAQVLYTVEGAANPVGRTQATPVKAQGKIRRGPLNAFEVLQDMAW